ncbi:papain family cysteine protease, partial [Oesophagostomum dentatum]
MVYSLPFDNCPITDVMAATRIRHGNTGQKLVLSLDPITRHMLVARQEIMLFFGEIPYPFPPCEHHSNKTHYDPCKHDLFPTPKCERTCIPSYRDRTYNDDKYYGRTAYGVDDKVEAIQKEILTHGPVEVAFEVYEDFLTYSSGVYVMLGWGVEQGMPYWLLANSWNEDWGENGKRMNGPGVPGLTDVFTR